MSQLDKFLPRQTSLLNTLLTEFVAGKNWTKLFVATALRSADLVPRRLQTKHVFREIRHLVVLLCSARIASWKFAALAHCLSFILFGKPPSHYLVQSSRIYHWKYSPEWARWPNQMVRCGNSPALAGFLRIICMKLEDKPTETTCQAWVTPCLRTYQITLLERRIIQPTKKHKKFEELSMERKPTLQG